MAARDLNIFTCFRCFTLVHGDFKDLTKHIRQFHVLNTSGKSSSLLVCSQNGCQEKFFYWHQYRSHILACHLLTNNVVNEQMRVLNLENELPGPMDFEEESGNNSEEVTAEKQTVSIELMVAKLMLNLKANHNAIHESLNYICQEFQEIILKCSNSEALVHQGKHYST